MSIQPLPSDVVAQIKSSVVITSLNGVVYELVQNSLDAGSTKIDVSIDYSRGACVLEDDGLGILPAEFGVEGGLGKLYHSSKLKSPSPVHGGQGTFIAALSAMAFISITSHHHQHRSHNTMSIHQSEVVSRQTPAPAQHHLPFSAHGTRITVCDLFGNMPVRVKQRAIATEKQRSNIREWEELERLVVMLLLSWPFNVSCTLRESTMNRKLVVRASDPGTAVARGTDVARCCAVLSQASLISHDERVSWVSVAALTSDLKISGAISLEPNATKHIQFLSFGIRPLIAPNGKSIIHDEINRLFANSAFGNEHETEKLETKQLLGRAEDRRYKGNAYTNKELKTIRKGVDRWPKYYINIEPIGSSQPSIVCADIVDGKLDNLGSIMELLQKTVMEFLTRHHFRPNVSRGHGTTSISRADAGRTLGQENSRVTPDKVKKQDVSFTKNNPTMSRSAFDPFGTNVKLPSFRQATSADCPSDTWTQVKRGAIVPKIATSNIPHAGDLSNGAALIQRPSTAPPTTREMAPVMIIKTSAPDLNERSIRRLTDENGMVIRRPFEDVETTIVGSEPAVAGPLQQTHRSIESQDGIMAWINPVTMVESSINQRTGMIVPAKELAPSEGPTAALTSRPRLSAQVSSARVEPSPWVANILKQWDNPIFQTAEHPVPQISLEGPNTNTQQILRGQRRHCSQVDIDRAFKDVSANINGRISKGALRTAEILSQVDKKFILAKLKVSKVPVSGGWDEEILVMIDQHAADERVRVETLMQELCTPMPASASLELLESGVLSTVLESPISFEVPTKEYQLLRVYKSHFSTWGIFYTVPQLTSRSCGLERFTVNALPPAITERCRLNPRLLIELIRTELHVVNDRKYAPVTTSATSKLSWMDRIRSCPQGILDMLYSRACRSAIMFNDELTKEQCKTLVRSLAGCAFPFTCAHGRPSLVPLVGIGMLGSGGTMLDDYERPGDNFRKVLHRWQRATEL